MDQTQTMDQTDNNLQTTNLVLILKFYTNLYTNFETCI